VRTPLALALVLAACGPADRRDSAAAHDAPSAPVSQGPDPILLRVPRAGGIARAYAYPKLDSAVWRSAARVPPLARILAFDQESGLLAYVDSGGLPGRIDLRLGDVQRATKVKLASLASADGSGIYGVQGGAVTRLTPTDVRPWKFTPPAPAREIFPQPDGSLLVAAERTNATVVWRLRPPDTTLVDSAVLAPTTRGVSTASGDRLYFAAAGGLVGLRNREFKPSPGVDFATPVSAVVPTPSGDRVYVSAESSAVVSVVDRYSDEIEARIQLPGQVRDLRMDALGRYLLARPASGDSTWVVAVGTGRLIGAVRTAWLADLPLVVPDGSLALAQGADVVLVDGETLRPRHTVKGGRADFWHVVLWNGFRPRAAGIDEPVTFGPGAESDSGAAAPPRESTAVADTTRVAGAPAIAVAPGDSARAARPPAAGVPAPPPAPAARPRAGFVVQFAAVRTVAAAEAQAAGIRVEGKQARVMSTDNEGTPIYRVVLGPFATRGEAERIGRAAARDYWIFEGLP
jgi:cell division septation protein DedD